MFKAPYNISKNKIKLDSLFFKKYRVFDGQGSIYFATLHESRSYVQIKSQQLKKLFDSSKWIYKALLACYLDNSIKFRITDHNSNTINSLLVDCLDLYKKMSSSYLPHYIVGRVLRLYRYFSDISKLLNMKVLYSTINQLYSSFIVKYPQFGLHLSENQSLTINNYEKCII